MFVIVYENIINYYLLNIFCCVTSGKNYKKDCTKDGMYRMQVQKTNPAKKMQAFRIGWRQKEEGKRKRVRMPFNRYSS